MRLLGIGDWVFLCSPEAIKSYYRAPVDVLVSGEIKAKTVGFMLGADTDFTLDGEAHAIRKRMLLPKFNGHAVLTYVDSIRQATEEMIAAWPVGKPFAMMPEALRLSLLVMTRVMFGSHEQHRLDRLVTAFGEFSEKCMRSPLINMPFLQFDLGRFSPWGRIMYLRRQTREIFNREIERRRSSATENSGFLYYLMNDVKAVDGSRLSDETVLDQLLTLLFAGHETSGGLMTWVIAGILAHPEVLAELDAELDAVLSDRPIEGRHLGHLKYLDAVIQEGFRMARATAFNSFRLVKKPFQVEGFEVSPGRVVAPLFYTLGHREDLFPNPHKFKPRRFLGRKQDLAWSPFGQGTRICTGKGLAQVELKVSLATIFQRTRLHLTEITDEIERHGLFFGPKHGLRVVLDKHLPASG